MKNIAKIFARSDSSLRGMALLVKCPTDIQGSDDQHVRPRRISQAQFFERWRSLMKRHLTADHSSKCFPKMIILCIIFLNKTLTWITRCLWQENVVGTVLLEAILERRINHARVYPRVWNNLQDVHVRARHDSPSHFINAVTKMIRPCLTCKS